MKRVVIGIIVMMMIFVVSQMNSYATSEENTVSNDTSQETITEEKQQEKKEETPTETKKNETMYVQERCNIRESYSKDSNRVGGLDVGTEVTVIAEYSNGWYKIKYDGGEAYIKAGILRSTKPQVEEPEEETQTTQEQNTQTQNTTQTPISGSQDEVDIEIAEMINEIGVLPQVGKNIADYLSIGVIIIAVLLVIYINYKF